MTFDPIIILSAVCVLLSLSGLYLFSRLHKAERELITLKADTLTIVCDLGAEARTNALDICRIGDMASDTRSEVTTHAQVINDHTLRLSVLEGEQ